MGSRPSLIPPLQKRSLIKPALPTLSRTGIDLALGAQLLAASLLASDWISARHWAEGEGDVRSRFRMAEWEPHIHAPGSIFNDQFGVNSLEAYIAAPEAATPPLKAIGTSSPKNRSLGDRLGAGNLDQRTTHEGRFLRGEKRNKRGDFFGLADTAEGNKFVEVGDRAA
jgi:hypothetical protein